MYSSTQRLLLLSSVEAPSSYTMSVCAYKYPDFGTPTNFRTVEIQLSSSGVFIEF